MGNLWLKIKVWTKITLFTLLSLAALIFVFQNVNKPVKLWLWNEIDTTLLKVLFFTALITAILTFLLGTALRTLRQIKELRARNRHDALERDLADMKAKAAMLKTKPLAGTATANLGEPPLRHDTSDSLRDVDAPISGRDDAGNP